MSYTNILALKRPYFYVKSSFLKNMYGLKMKILKKNQNFSIVLFRYRANEKIWFFFQIFHCKTMYIFQKFQSYINNMLFWVISYWCQGWRNWWCWWCYSPTNSWQITWYTTCSTTNVFGRFDIQQHHQFYISSVTSGCSYRWR